MGTLNSKNKILPFAPKAKTASATDYTDGNYYVDNVWEGDSSRQSGVSKGVAQSVVYNTALRQASFMASVLAEGIAERFNVEVSCGSQKDKESDYIDLIQALSDKFKYRNFIQPSEINNAAIADDAVTTAKILNGNVTPSKLGTVVEGSSISKSANGLSVTLSQDANKGLSIDFTGSSVTQSNTVKCDKASTATYLCGTSSGGYITPKYIEALQVSANGTLTSSSSIEATSFNAMSDIRLKDNIKTSNMDATNIVSTIDIVDFNYKANPNVKQFGVIAQALKEVCPEVVVEGEDGYLRIKESKLVYILWKALQDANERIARLESIIYNK